MYLAQRLNELAHSHTAGLLSDDEYRLLRQSAFEQFSEPVAELSNVTSPSSKSRTKPPTVQSQPSRSTLKISTFIRRPPPSLSPRDSSRPGTAGSASTSPSSPESPVHRNILPRLFHRKPELVPLRTESLSHSPSPVRHQHGPAAAAAEPSNSLRTTKSKPSLSALRRLGQKQQPPPASPISSHHTTNSTDSGSEPTSSKELREAVASTEAELEKLVEAFEQLERSALRRINRGGRSSAHTVRGGSRQVTGAHPSIPSFQTHRRDASTRTDVASISSGASSYENRSLFLSSKSFASLSPTKSTAAASPGSPHSPSLLSPSRSAFFPRSPSHATAAPKLPSPSKSYFNLRKPSTSRDDAGSLAAPLRRRGSVSSVSSKASKSTFGTTLGAKRLYSSPQGLAPSRSTGSSLFLPHDSTHHRNNSGFLDYGVDYDGYRDEDEDEMDGDEDAGGDRERRIRELQDIQLRKKEAMERYVQRIEYLKAKVKGAELHEKLMRK